MTKLKESRWTFRSTFRLATVLVLAITFGEIAVAAPPSDCDDVMDDFVLPCFEAYKWDLQPFHLPEIKKIAVRAKKTLESGGTVNIDGYGVFFRVTDPAIENSIKRADRVRDALIKELKKLGRKSGFSRIVAAGRGDSSDIEESTTRYERWFLRRVEVSFEPAKRPDPVKPGKCVVNETAIRHLRDAVIKFSDKKVESQQRCLRNKLISYYNCAADGKAQVYNPKFVHGPGGLPKLKHRWTRYVDVYEGGRNCHEESAGLAEICLSTLRRAYWFGLDQIDKEIFDIASVEGGVPSTIRSMPECRRVRKMLREAKSPDNPYRCFREKLEGLERWCVEK